MNKYLSILALVFAAFGAHAATLLAPGANDQVPMKLVAAPQAKAAAALDRTPVAVSHMLDGTELDAAPQTFTAQSREFWSDVGETELRSGVKFTTTTPGALIRLSPQGGAAAALDPAGVLLRANGRTLSANDASAAVADAKALRNAGMSVPEGTLALRLSAASGSGEMEIAAPHAQGRYLVHVFEPASALVLSFAADRDTALVGTPITFHASLATGTLRLASGLITAPDGYSADLHFTRAADGSYAATFTPDAAHNNGPQLWEAHVFTSTQSGRLNVLRDAKTAFAVSTPSARFSGSAQTSGANGNLQVALDVAVSNASRYQVSAVLYGTGADGALHPAALAQSAAWLSKSGNIGLGFDAASVGALHAPFELRDLRLVDQANMSVIERRARALVID